MDVNKEKLKVLYDELLKFADYRDQQPVKYFVHCTSITKRENITRQGLLLGSYSEYPLGSPLSKNEDLKGVWFMISLYDGQLLDHSPYGTQRVKIPVGQLMFHMKTAEDKPASGHAHVADVASASDAMGLVTLSSKNEKEWDEYEDEIEDDEDGNDEPTEEDETGNSKRGSKHQKGKSRDKKRDRKKRAMERKKETPKIALVPEIKPKKKFALLFFENAYHYSGGSQYVRLVLIKFNNPLVQFCKDNMLELNIFENPFFNWNGWKLKSIQNDKTSNWRIMVEVFAVGDHKLDSLKEKSNWDECGTHKRAGCPPCIGVFHPLNMK